MLEGGPVFPGSLADPWETILKNVTPGCRKIVVAAAVEHCFDLPRWAAVTRSRVDYFPCRCHTQRNRASSLSSWYVDVFAPHCMDHNRMMLPDAVQPKW